MENNVLLIGSGAREHIIAEALIKNKSVKLFAAIVHRNPGIVRIANKVIFTETDVNEIIRFAKKNKITFCVIGPEKPLQEGITDALFKAGFPSASPTKAAAKIETSKSFMRNLLDKYKIPGQIRYLFTSSLNKAIKFCDELKWRVAIKPVGLTGGKGVKVWGDHFRTKEDVLAYVQEILTKGISGYKQVVIEELLEGQEFTVHFFSDGETSIPMPAVQDHKRLLDGDRGPNTGGMGSYTIANGLLPFLNQQEYEKACEIGSLVIQALKTEGTPFKGVLYGQFMLTAKDVKIIEFNARLGDPEAMNILSLLKSDFTKICQSIIKGNLNKNLVIFYPKASVVRYVVPKGYGINPEKGTQVVVDEFGIRNDEASIFYASCDLDQLTSDPRRIIIHTTGSRTLAIAGIDSNLSKAHKVTERALRHIKGQVFYRKDIGSREAIQKKVKMLRELRRQA